MNPSELHVFATTSFSNAVKDRYQLNVRDFDSINGTLFNEFTSPRTEIYYQAKLREAIKQGSFKNEKKLLNRLPELLETFKVFVELYGNELRSENHDELQCEVIDLMNVLFEDEKFRFYYERKSNLTKEEISIELCGNPFLQTIYFYEIDYLNYFRMNIIHWLKLKGFQIELRVPYSNTFTETFSYWNEIYSVAIRSNLAAAPSINKSVTSARANRLGSFNEGDPVNVQAESTVKVMEFTTPNDFQKYYESSTEDILLAVRPEEVSRIVHHKKNKAYEDEFGKFIYYMQFCKHEQSKIHLSYDTLAELVTSGWVHHRHINGKDAYGLLIHLQEYMTGIETIDEVIERLKKLQELELFSRSLDRENREDASSRDRRNQMKSYMLNPFRTFSVLHAERYDTTITQLLELVVKVKKICEYIIPANDEAINVNEAFERWTNVLEELVPSEEKVFWTKVFQAKVEETWKFSMPEIMKLIYLLVEKMQSEKREIHSINKLEEILVKNQQEKTIHITNLTLENFPQSYHSELTVFFDYSELKEVVKRFSAEDKNLTNILLHALWVDYTLKKNFEKLGMYQLFTVLANHNGNVTFSWINNLDDKSMRSVHLDILADLFCDGKVASYEPNNDEEFLARIPEAKEEPASYETLRLTGKIPDLFWLDHDFCPKKFFLTTFIDKQPIYETDFHQQFLFGKIGKMHSFSNKAKTDFNRLIFPLFPQWTETKKRNLIDVEYPMSFYNYQTFENISYPKEAKGIQILRSINRENRRTKARNQYRNNRNANEIKLLKQFQEYIGRNEVDATPGNHCAMCPHLTSCTEGWYSIDNAGR